MKDSVKKMIVFSIDNYDGIESKLEKMAAKGLILEKLGSFFWTFRKTEPQSLKYTVTYFSEGSIFNPSVTDNQQTYFDYAESAGWQFVTEFNQMQIFSTNSDNTIPFETDEKEKLTNIKKCMKKSFIPSTLLLIVVFGFNLFVNYNSYKLDPIDFMSSWGRLLPVLMIASVVILGTYSLLNYWLWVKRSEKSIANGGACLKRNSPLSMAISIFVIALNLILLFFTLLVVSAETGWVAMLISVIQVPIFIFVFTSSIKYLKKKKVSATINKVVSITLLTIACFAYMAFIVMIVIKFDLSSGNGSDYRIVDWKMNDNYSHEYKLYSDEIPLTCEDLYGETDYEYYSYESKIDRTILLARSAYSQDSLPAKDNPPRIEYEILEPKFDFMYQTVKEHLLTIDEWRRESSFVPIDNNIFGTTEAYQLHYEQSPTGEYILFFDDIIITLYMEEVLTTEQIEVIKEKLPIPA